jgi:hypothetical protein
VESVTSPTTGPTNTLSSMCVGRSSALHLLSGRPDSWSTMRSFGVTPQTSAQQVDDARAAQHAQRAQRSSVRRDRFMDARQRTIGVGVLPHTRVSSPSPCAPCTPQPPSPHRLAYFAHTACKYHPHAARVALPRRRECCRMWLHVCLATVACAAGLCDTDAACRRVCSWTWRL